MVLAKLSGHIALLTLIICQLVELYLEGSVKKAYFVPYSTDLCKDAYAFLSFYFLPLRVYTPRQA